LAYTAIIADGFVLKQFDINYSDKLQRERLHIAVVEDEVIIATNIVRKLNLLGYEAYPPCASFKEAAALFAAEKPDAALIDIRIKGQRDGIELAEYIRENYDVPIIFANDNGDEATLTITTRAAKGMPAVSPPAMLSNASNPALRMIVMVRKSIRVERMRGYEISLRQSI
jgi:CheY-like chemotaxis protein